MEFERNLASFLVLFFFILQTDSVDVFLILPILLTSLDLLLHLEFVSNQKGEPFNFIEYSTTFLPLPPSPAPSPLGSKLNIYRNPEILSKNPVQTVWNVSVAVMSAMVANSS